METVQAEASASHFLKAVMTPGACSAWYWRSGEHTSAAATGACTCTRRDGSTSGSSALAVGAGLHHSIDRSPQAFGVVRCLIKIHRRGRTQSRNLVGMPVPVHDWEWLSPWCATCSQGQTVILARSSTVNDLRRRCCIGLAASRSFIRCKACSNVTVI